jgi:hypothetical protein
MIARLLILLCAAVIPGIANAQSATHPVWAATPGAPWDATAHAAFDAALAKRGLGKSEVVGVANAQTSEAAELLKQGMTALAASAFDKAASLLGDAAQKAVATGGAGLAPGQAASLFFHLAVALQLAAGETYSEPFTKVNPPEALTAYLHAAVLRADDALDEAATQPLVEASWRIAKSLVTELPRSTLTVKARPRAEISVSDRAALPSPATFSDLPVGEHFVRVTEPGHVPWSTTVKIGGASNSIEVPATPLLSYDAASSRSLAQAAGAAFALVGQLHLGDKIEIDLRLVDAKTGEIRSSTAVPVEDGPDSPTLVAAVLRLDEAASQADLARRALGSDGQPRTALDIAPPPQRPAKNGPSFTTDSQGWFRQHWPLAAAIGTAIGTAFTLGMVVARDRR